MRSGPGASHAQAAGDQCECVNLALRCHLSAVALAASRRRRPKALTASDVPRRPAEIAGWNIDIDRDGNNLPPGSGSVSHGHEVFDQQCAACHGAEGRGRRRRSAGRRSGHARDAKAGKTVGSYWPYAPTLFDYIRRAMPQNAPQSLSNDDVYAVSAYILNLNGLLPADATLDASTLSAIKMPNREHVRRRSRARRQKSGMREGLLKGTQNSGAGSNDRVGHIDRTLPLSTRLYPPLQR